MPFSRTSDLPNSVKDNLPSHAEEIYKEAFNSAWTQYDKQEERRGRASREEVAHKVAWSAVKRKYKKDDEGNWVEKD